MHMRKEELAEKVLSQLILPVWILLFTVIQTSVSSISFQKGLLFFLFQMLGILAPGKVLLDYLIPNKQLSLHPMERVFLGYAAGFIWNLVLYLLLAILGALKLLSAVLWTVGILCVMLLIVKKKRNPEREQSEKIDLSSWILVLLCLTAIIAIRFLTYYGRNLMPTKDMPVTFPTQDLLYYIGNAVSAINGFPLTDLRFAGAEFRYHYFGSVQLAVESIATGIDVLRLEFSLVWMQESLLFVGCFWCLLARMTKTLRARALGLFLVFFTTGVESIVYVAFAERMYRDSFGMTLGLSFGVLFLYLLFLQVQSERWMTGLFIFTLLALFACEGTKAPVALVMMAVAGCICFEWLLQKKYILAFGYGCALVGIFLVVYFGIVSKGMSVLTSSGTGVSVQFSLTGHLYECGLGKMYFDWVAGGMPQWLGKLLIIAFFYFGCNIAVYTLFAAGLRRNLFGCGNSFARDLCIGVFFGLLLTLITKQSGNSQMYFAMSSLPLAAAVSVRAWEGFRFKWMRLAILPLVIVSFLCLLQTLQPCINEGVCKLSGDGGFETTANNSLTWEEWEGYAWVRESLPQEAICMTNVIGMDAQYESFIVGVCTQRQMYLEGWRYASRVASEEQVQTRLSSVRELLQGNTNDDLLKNDVDYLIWTVRYGEPPQKLLMSLGDPIYDNGAVMVFDLQ